MSHRGAIGSSPMANAAPLAEWNLPPGFATLRRLMEARMIKAGRRDRAIVRHWSEDNGEGSGSDACPRPSASTIFMPP